MVAFRALLSLCLCGCLVGFAEASHNVVVVLDDSGSMADTMRSNRRLKKIDAAKQALVGVLRQLPEEARVGIVALNGGQDGERWILPLAALDDSQINSAMARIRADGGTPLGEVLKVAADELLRVRAKEHYGIYRLLIVTDGEANDPEFLDAILPDVLARGVAVDVIGVDMATNHSLATKVHTYRRADDPASLSQAISAVFAESQSDAAGDAGETDFEMLQGLPDEVARAALTALAESGNAPIQPVANRWENASGPADAAFDSAHAAGHDPAFEQPPAPQSWFVVYFGIFVVVVLCITIFGKRNRVK